MKFAPGTKLGDYVLADCLGSGGMAEVYSAYRLGLGGFMQPVALKCLTADVADDEEFLSQFVNEAHTGSRLQHPNIVAIQDFNCVDGVYYIAMEYVDGVDLRFLMSFLKARNRRLSPAMAAHIMRMVLKALGYAYHCVQEDGRPLRVIHRDLKPANVMVNRLGQVKVADYGIAKAPWNPHQTRTDGLVKGTLPYMSPEQLLGTPLTAASDLFAAGTVLFELLAFERLFQGKPVTRLIERIQRADVKEQLASLEGDAARFVPVLEKALARDPRDRFPDARAFGNALEPLCAGERDLVDLTRDVNELLAEKRSTVAPDAVEQGTGTLPPQTHVPATKDEVGLEESTIHSQMAATRPSLRTPGAFSAPGKPFRGSSRGNDLAPPFPATPGGSRVSAAPVSRPRKIRAGPGQEVPTDLTGSHGMRPSRRPDSVCSPTARDDGRRRPTEPFGLADSHGARPVHRATPGQGPWPTADPDKSARSACATRAPTPEPPTANLDDAADGPTDLAGTPELPPAAVCGIPPRRGVPRAALLLIALGATLFSGTTPVSGAHSRTAPGGPPATCSGPIRWIRGSEMIAVGMHHAGNAARCTPGSASFFIDRERVTVGEYMAFLEACPPGSPCGPPSPPGFLTRLDPATLEEIAREPITFVGWNDAAAYARWKGKRLPTASEWESAFLSGAISGSSPAEWRAGAPARCGTDSDEGPGNRTGGSPTETERHVRAGVTTPHGALALSVPGHVREWAVDDAPGDPPRKIVLGKTRSSDPFSQATRVDFERRSMDPEARTADLGFRCAMDAGAAENLATPTVLARLRSEKKLRVGVATTPGDEQGYTLSGMRAFEEAFMSSVARELGVAMVVATGTPRDMMARLARGEVSVVVGEIPEAATPRAERLSTHLVSDMSLMVPAGSTVADLDHLAGKVVGIARDAGLRPFVTTMAPGAVILEIAPVDAAALLVQERIDAALVAAPLAVHLATTSRGKLRIAQRGIQRTCHRAVVRQGERSLFLLLDEAVRAVRTSGDYRRLVARHLGAGCLEEVSGPPSPRQCGQSNAVPNLASAPRSETGFQASPLLVASPDGTTWAGSRDWWEE